MQSEENMNEMAQTQAVPPVPQEPKKTFSKEDVENLVQARLAAAQKKHQEDLAAARAQATPQMQQQDGEQSIPLSQLEPFIQQQAEQRATQKAAELKQQEKLASFTSKLKEAGSQDPDFQKKLDEGVKSGAVDENMLQGVIHLDQPALVMNHLLNDPDDKAAFDAIPDGPQFHSQRKEFVNRLKKQLNSQAGKNTKSYKPAKDIQNGVSIGSDMDRDDFDNLVKSL